MAHSHPHASRFLIASLGLAAAFSAALPQARAHDTWSRPFEGIRTLHRVTERPRLSIHVAIVDLTAPGVRLTATTPDGKRATVSSFAKRKKVQLAVNGDFFNLTTREPSCLAMGEGKPWPGTGDSERCGQLAFGRGQAEITAPGADFERQPWMTEIVGGHPLLLRKGEAVHEDHPLMVVRHPRTAAGLSRDKTKLFLMVVDGRQGHSVGITGVEIAAILKELGAWTVLNLDGGGSSAMYVAGKGVVNRPSDGQERQSANHVGVYAQPRRHGVQWTAEEHDDGESTGDGANDPADATEGAYGCPPEIRHGYYCGGDRVTGDPNTLYDCRQGVLVGKRRCDSGCHVSPRGVDDYCELRRAPRPNPTPSFASWASDGEPGKWQAASAPEHDYRRVSFRGVTLNVRTREMVLLAEGYARTLLGDDAFEFRLGQGSYHRGVQASAGTHDGGGAIDVSVRGRDGRERRMMVKALRMAGFAAWPRSAAQFGSDHIHGIGIGDHELQWLAKQQVEQYFDGRDGLAGHGPDPAAPQLYPDWARRYE